jgi:hypothetical protein
VQSKNKRSCGRTALREKIMKESKENEFERFDKVMSGLLAVPYKELQVELEKHRKKKARKKRAKMVNQTSESGPSRDSGGEG